MQRLTKIQIGMNRQLKLFQLIMNQMKKKEILMIYLKIKRRKERGK